MICIGMTRPHAYAEEGPGVKWNGTEAGLSDSKLLRSLTDPMYLPRTRGLQGNAATGVDHERIEKTQDGLITARTEAGVPDSISYGEGWRMIYGEGDGARTRNLWIDNPLL